MAGDVKPQQDLHELWRDLLELAHSGHDPRQERVRALRPLRNDDSSRKVKEIQHMEHTNGQILSSSE